MSNEQAVLFPCADECLLGILHLPEKATTDIGVLLVVGGPQYRVGSHRQFVLLARALAEAGIPVFRFDYSGMGDSSGEARDFEAISQDITAAKATFLSQATGVTSIVLWGLCDAASANAFYAVSTADADIVGQVALNPWVRTPEGEAEAYVKHYYAQRLLSREFWRKVFGLKMDFKGAIGDFLRKLQQSRSRDDSAESVDNRPLPQRLEQAQLAYAGETLLLLSGQDLTAREYEDRVAESSEWGAWLRTEKVTVHRLEQADHTFSRAVWRDQVSDWTRDWVLKLGRR